MKAITGRQIGTVGAGRHRVAGTPGLFVLVHASGARSWVYRGWNGTKEIMRGLGSVIDVSVIEARNAAIRLRAGIIDGAELPLRRSRIAQRAAAHTWQDAFDRLTARKAGTVRESTVRAADSVWRKHIAADARRRRRRRYVTGGRDQPDRQHRRIVGSQGAQPDPRDRIACRFSRVDRHEPGRRGDRRCTTDRRRSGPARATTARCRTR